MHRTVLVVEDTQTLRCLFIQILERLGLQCDGAADGNEAFDHFQGYRGYELILMDVMMPVCDGYQATRLIRTFEKNNKLARTPIIAITCAEDQESCIEAGMDDYWAKPLLPDHLIQIAEKWLPDKKLKHTDD
jgi:CheY-like chemotaxis protein